MVDLTGVFQLLSCRMEETLKEEFETFSRLEEELKKTALGKFAVIKDSELVGTFDDLEGALAAGARRFGLEPYLVRHIGEPTQTVTIPALSLGLVRANS